MISSTTSSKVTILTGGNMQPHLVPVQAPAVAGIAPWLVHELIYCRWYYLRLAHSGAQDHDSAINE